MRRAADALDADLVYAIVPRKTLRTTISDRARAIAIERLQPIANPLAPVEQSPPSQQLEQQIAALASEIEKKPRELWR